MSYARSMTGSDAPPAGYRGDPVALEELLASRERRASGQAMLLERHRVPVVSLTIVMPGPVKANGWARHALQEGIVLLENLCHRMKWPVLSHEQKWLQSGPEALYAIDADPRDLKELTIALENNRPIGRLWDFDVIDLGMSVLSRKAFGFPPRRCLVCERSARECGRDRRHSLNMLLATIGTMMDGHNADTRN
jgi:holo-ACP synthase